MSTVQHDRSQVMSCKGWGSVWQMGPAGEKAVEALARYDRNVIGMFKAAAAKLVQEVGSAEDAVAMALAKITGLSGLKVTL